MSRLHFQTYSICKYVCFGIVYQMRPLGSLEVVGLKSYGSKTRLYHYFWTRKSTLWQEVSMRSGPTRRACYNSIGLYWLGLGDEVSNWLWDGFCLGHRMHTALNKCSVLTENASKGHFQGSMLLL